MNTDKIIELAFYTLPALITGGVAYYAFETFVKKSENRQKFQLMLENQKQSLPLRLQAYERMVLFLERINPVKLTLRIAPISEDKKNYENMLIQNIEQEFEHNLTQQIYVSNECWTMILTAKNTTIKTIRNIGFKAEIDTVEKFREAILNNQLENESATNLAVDYIKNEVKSFL